MTRGYSAVVLAGGDGTRLRSLTRQLAGDDRPKQFCHLLGAETLLGVAPDRAETEYGWIEPSELLLGPSPSPLYAVRRFWEKPSAPVVERLVQAGCLWNSFVVVANPGMLARLIRGAVPELVEALAPLVSRLGTPWEEETARAVYVRLPTTDFSKQVLQARPADLAVLPITGVEWNDLGDPARVLATRKRTRWRLASA